MTLNTIGALCVGICAGVAQASVSVTTLDRFTPINAGTTECPSGGGACVLRYASSSSSTKVHLVANRLLPSTRYGVAVFSYANGFSVSPDQPQALVTDARGHGTFEYTAPGDISAGALTILWICDSGAQSCAEDPFGAAFIGARAFVTETGAQALTGFTAVNAGLTEDPNPDGACVLKLIVNADGISTRMQLMVSHLLPNTQYGVALTDFFGGGFIAPPDLTGGALVTNSNGQGTFEYTMPGDVTVQPTVTLWRRDANTALCDPGALDCEAQNGARVLIRAEH